MIRFINAGLKTINAFISRYRPLFVFLFLFSCVYMVYHIMYNHEEIIQQAKLSMVIEKEVKQLEYEIRKDIRTLLTVGSFYRASQFVNPNEFEKFTNLYIKKSARLSALGWVPKVKRRQKRQYEEQIKSKLKSFEDSGYTDINERLVYNPIIYISPKQEFLKLLGTNINSNTTLRNSLIKSSKDKAVSLTDRPISITINGKKKHYLFAFEETATTDNNQGHVIALFDLAYLTSGFLEKNTDLDLAIKVEGEFGVIYEDQRFSRINATEITENLTIADKKWKVILKNITEQPAGLHNNSLTVLALGILISLLITVLAYRSHNQTEQIRTQAKERQRQLQLAYKNMDSVVEKLEITASHISDGLWEINPKTKQVYFSENFKQLLGYKEKDPHLNTLKSFYQIIHVDYVDFIKEKIEEGRNKEISFEKSIKMMCRNGHYKWFLFRRSTASLKNENMVLGTLIDIQIYKDIESMKTSIMDTMSTELKVPLIAVNNALERIINKNDDIAKKENRELLEISKCNCERIIFIINEFMDLNRMEAIEIELELAKHNVTKVLSEVIIDNAEFEQKFHVRINVVGLEQEAIFANIDLVRFRQVIDNVIHNACRYSSQNNEVIVGLTYNEEQIAIYVQNKAENISQDEVDKINSYLDADNAESYQQKNLTISNHIMKAHKGALVFNVLPNQVAEFQIILHRA